MQNVQYFYRTCIAFSTSIEHANIKTISSKDYVKTLKQKRTHQKHSLIL